MDEDARARFRARWREKIEGDPTKVRLYKDIGTGIATAGIEYYLPLFFEQTATLFDYLGAEAALVLHGEIDAALQRFWTDTRERHRFLQHDQERPDPAAGRPVPASRGLLRPGWRPCDARRARAPSRSSGRARCPDLSVDRGAPEPLKKLQLHVGTTPHRVLIVAESEGRRESLLELLRDSRIEPPQRRLAGRVRDRRRALRDRRGAARGRLRLARTARRQGDPVRHRDRALRDLADRRAASASRSRSATSTR